MMAASISKSINKKETIMNFPKLETYFNTLKAQYPALVEQDYNFAPMAVIAFICDWQDSGKHMLPAYLYLAKVYKNYPDIAEAMADDLSSSSEGVNSEIKWNLLCKRIDSWQKAA